MEYGKSILSSQLWLPGMFMNAGMSAPEPPVHVREIRGGEGWLRRGRRGEVREVTREVVESMIARRRRHSSM